MLPGVRLMGQFMGHSLRFLGRISLLLPWVALGLLAVTLVFPLSGLSLSDSVLGAASPAARSARGLAPSGARLRASLIRHWSRVLLKLCGVAVRVRGKPLRAGAVLFVANHVSWLDIFVLNRTRATVFIAKGEIRRWPLLGWLVAGAGTIFINRSQRHAVREVARQMRARFQAGAAVGLFPEGATSDGAQVAHFYASLFAPACATATRSGTPATQSSGQPSAHPSMQASIQAIALRYFQHGARSACAAFVGEETLPANLWRVLGTTGLSVDVDYLLPLAHHDAHGQPHTRQHLARAAQAAIAQAV